MHILFASILNLSPSPPTLTHLNPPLLFIFISFAACFYNAYISSVLVSPVFSVLSYLTLLVFAVTVSLSYHVILSSFLHFAFTLPSLSLLLVPQPLTISRLDRPQTSLLTFLEKGFGKIICSTGFLTGNKTKFTEFPKQVQKEAFCGWT